LARLAAKKNFFLNVDTSSTGGRDSSSTFEARPSSSCCRRKEGGSWSASWSPKKVKKGQGCFNKVIDQLVNKERGWKKLL
jgi:hypothetical protein